MAIEILLWVALGMFILQFLISMGIWIFHVSEARRVGLSSSEKFWLKMGCFGTLTSPISILLLPIAVVVGIIRGGVIMFKTTQKHWS